MGDGLLGLYPISLVTGSLKPRPEASNPRIVSTGAGSDLIHRSAWNKNAANFAFWAFSEVRFKGILRSSALP
jgi:hypothetical protein